MNSVLLILKLKFNLDSADMINSNLGIFDGFYVLIELFNQIINGLRASYRNPRVLCCKFAALIFYQTQNVLLQVYRFISGKSKVYLYQCATLNSSSMPVTCSPTST